MTLGVVMLQEHFRSECIHWLREEADMHRLKPNSSTILLVVIIGACALWAASAAASGGERQEKVADLQECELTYSLKGWSVFYKRAKGEGLVTCADGQRAQVRIEVHGGGLTFGRSRIRDGFGQFSGVFDIDEVFGAYTGVQAHAGVLKSGDATAVTKGEVSLALAGTGEGFDLGLAVSRFKILPRAN